MFTSREFDSETGLYYYRARHYSPDLGRFLQRDPSGYETDALNLYSYVHNNPINYVDPTGLWRRKAKQWWKGYAYESVIPGPYGQPISEWSSRGRTSWGEPMKYTERASRAWRWGERIAVGVLATAAVVAGGATIISGASQVQSAVVTGFTKHGINQIINRNVGPVAVLQAVKNPNSVVRKIDTLGHVSYQYVGKTATVVLNKAKEVITAWSK